MRAISTTLNRWPPDRKLAARHRKTVLKRLIQAGRWRTALWPFTTAPVAVGDRRLHPKVNWVWHYLSNNVVCQVCGKHERNYPNYICDAHTHGMNLYGHPEFQVVIDYGAQELGRLLIRR